MSLIYSTIGKTILIAGIILGIITIFDYAIFLANNTGALYVNPYEYIQYGIIAALILSGITLYLKSRDLQR